MNPGLLGAAIITALLKLAILVIVTVCVVGLIAGLWLNRRRKGM